MSKSAGLTIRRAIPNEGTPWVASYAGRVLSAWLPDATPKNLGVIGDFAVQIFHDGHG